MALSEAELDTSAATTGRLGGPPAVDTRCKSRRRQSHNTGVLPMSQKEPSALGLSIKRKIAASTLYGPAPAETNMISMNAYRISGR